jgi:hypothetical protein
MLDRPDFSKRIPQFDRFELALLLTAALSFSLEISGATAFIPLALARHADFANIFDAAALVWSGHACDIYRLSLFNHVAFEAAVLAPLSAFSYQAAYWMMMALNTAFLFAALRVLRISWRLSLLAIAFVPTVVALLEGQDSMFTLFAFAYAAVWCEDRPFSTGLLVGLTVYKPQLALPVCALMFLWRRWRFVLGAFLSAAACLVASLAVVGAGGMVSYFHLVSSMSPAYQVHLRDMINLRGLLALFLSGRTLFLAIFVLSVVVMGVAFVAGRRIHPRLQLTIAILAACLVSYHLLASDLVVAIPAIALLAAACEQKFLRWSLFALFCGPALAVLLGPRHFFIAAIPLLAVFVGVGHRISYTREPAAPRLRNLKDSVLEVQP